MHCADETEFHRPSATCAKTSAVRRWLGRVSRLWTSRRHPHVRTLDDRALRDIGLRESERARLRHRHPSQHSHHPRG